MKRTMILFILLAFAVTMIPATPSSAQDTKELLQQKVAALKQSLAENKKALSQYAWTEKTQMSLKGEVKNTKIESCSYGPDGKVQKTLLTDPPEEKKMRGLKGRIAKNKKEDIAEYMERVASLIDQYVPPPPEQIKANVEGGDLSLNLLGGNNVQLQFKNFMKSGDVLSLTIDNVANAIRQLKVDTYLDDPGEAVTLAVDFQTLPNGTNYAANKNLNVAAKEIVINVAGSNYQKLAK